MPAEIILADISLNNDAFFIIKQLEIANIGGFTVQYKPIINSRISFFLQIKLRN